MLHAKVKSPHLSPRGVSLWASRHLNVTSITHVGAHLGIQKPTPLVWFLYHMTRNATNFSNALFARIDFSQRLSIHEAQSTDWVWSTHRKEVHQMEP